MKKLITLMLIVLIAAPIQAATYSDRLIQFEYDDTYQAEIVLSGYENETIRVYPVVYYDDLMTSTTVGISLYKNYEGDKDVWIEKFIEDSEIISDDPLEVRTSENGLKKVLSLTDNYAAIVSMLIADESSKDYEFCRQIYDTAVVSDYFKTDELSEELFKLRDRFICFNIPFSQDVIPYLEQCITILDDALNGGNLKKDSEAVENLKEAVNRLAVQSGYLGDRSIALYIVPSKYDFTFADTHPEDLIEAKLTLQETIEMLKTK